MCFVLCMTYLLTAWVEHGSDVRWNCLGLSTGMRQILVFGKNSDVFGSAAWKNFILGYILPRKGW